MKHVPCLAARSRKLTEFEIENVVIISKFPYQSIDAPLLIIR